MDHYQTYGCHKGYTTPVVSDKHIRRMDREIWQPAQCRADMAFLEVGCGTGLFLEYLRQKGVKDFLGIDHDPDLTDIVPEAVRGSFQVADVEAFLENQSSSYDRIVLLDVIEHFDAVEGSALLHGLARILKPEGRIILKVPNAGSPWGQQFQYGDLTHKTAYTPESMRQQAIAAGLECMSVYAHDLGSPARRRWETLVHGILNRILTSPPEIWAGNFYAVLRRGQENTA